MHSTTLINSQLYDALDKLSLAEISHRMSMQSETEKLTIADAAILLHTSVQHLQQRLGYHGVTFDNLMSLPRNRLELLHDYNRKPIVVKNDPTYFLKQSFENVHKKLLEYKSDEVAVLLRVKYSFLSSILLVHYPSIKNMNELTSKDQKTIDMITLKLGEDYTKSIATKIKEQKPTLDQLKNQSRRSSQLEGKCLVEFADELTSMLEADAHERQEHEESMQEDPETQGDYRWEEPVYEFPSSSYR